MLPGSTHLSAEHGGNWRIACDLRILKPCMLKCLPFFFTFFFLLDSSPRICRKLLSVQSTALIAISFSIYRLSSSTLLPQIISKVKVKETFCCFLITFCHVVFSQFGVLYLSRGIMVLLSMMFVTIVLDS